MENFFYDTEFCIDISDFIDTIGFDEDDINELPEDWFVEVWTTKSEKIFAVTEQWVVDAIMRATEQFEDRFPEDSEDVFEQIEDVVKRVIDIDRFNGLLPELYYPTKNKMKITKQELIDFIS